MFAGPPKYLQCCVYYFFGLLPADAANSNIFVRKELKSNHLNTDPAPREF